MKLISSSIFITLLLLSTTSVADTTATTPVDNNCPTGYSCCPDMSNTMDADGKQWQLTGQPLHSNTFAMAWWTSTVSTLADAKGYVTCYYNLNGKNPYTLESIYPALKPAKGSKKWLPGKMENAMECTSTQLSDCPFLIGKY